MKSSCNQTVMNVGFSVPQDCSVSALLLVSQDHWRECYQTVSIGEKAGVVPKFIQYSRLNPLIQSRVTVPPPPFLFSFARSQCQPAFVPDTWACKRRAPPRWILRQHCSSSSKAVFDMAARGQWEGPKIHWGWAGYCTAGPTPYPNFE